MVNGSLSGGKILDLEFIYACIVHIKFQSINKMCSFVVCPEADDTPNVQRRTALEQCQINVDTFNFVISMSIQYSIVLLRRGYPFY